MQQLKNTNGHKKTTLSITFQDCVRNPSKKKKQPFWKNNFFFFRTNTKSLNLKPGGYLRKGKKKKQQNHNFKHETQGQGHNKFLRILARSSCLYVESLAIVHWYLKTKAFNVSVSCYSLLLCSRLDLFYLHLLLPALSFSLSFLLLSLKEGCVNWRRIWLWWREELIYNELLQV